MSLVLQSLPRDAGLVLIAMNPKAGARCGLSRVEELTAALGAEGLQVEVHTELPALKLRAEASLAAGRLRAVVAAGGDGTVNALVNLLDPAIPLAILPLGTENLLAKYLEVVHTPAAVARMIAEGAMVRLDAAKAGERTFLLMAGCGFDADVVQRLHAGRRGHIRHWSYLKPIWESIRNYRYPELRLHCRTSDDQPETVVHARWAFVTNLPRYAVRIQFAPQALGTDGLLDVCTFRGGSLWHGLWYLSCILRGRHVDLKDCLSTQVRSVRIEADVPVPYQLDGDPGGALPVEIQALPGRLAMIVPRSWAEANGFRVPDGRVEVGTDLR